MRIFNFEFGIHRTGSAGPNKGDIVWTWYEFNRCCNGCLIFDLGPFYFTILQGECK